MCTADMQTQASSPTAFGISLGLSSAATIGNETVSRAFRFSKGPVTADMFDSSESVQVFAHAGHPTRFAVDEHPLDPVPRDQDLRQVMGRGDLSQ